jgi:hypothetical protein
MSAPSTAISLDNSKIGIVKKNTNEHQSLASSLNYPNENRFFKGLLIALPACISLWVLIIWLSKSLIF